MNYYLLVIKLLEYFGCLLQSWSLDQRQSPKSIKRRSIFFLTLKLFNLNNHFHKHIYKKLKLNFISNNKNKLVNSKFTS